MSAPKTFNKKPPSIEAVQFNDSSSVDDIETWLQGEGEIFTQQTDGVIYKLIIVIDGVSFNLKPSDWLYRGAIGDYGVYTDETLHEVYEEDLDG